MTVLSCAALRELAAELAAGAVDGPDRAAALAHCATCESCRSHVAELTRTVDLLYAAAPEAEPPPGFETRVLARMVPGGSRGGDRRRIVAAAAAVALLAGGFAIGHAVGRDARLYAGPMLDARRAAVGRAVIHGGTDAFVYVALDAWEDSGDYRVEVVLDDGRHLDVAPIRLTAGRGTAAGRLPAPVDDVRAVWVTDAAHRSWCAFRL
ncbi:MAG: hypothetical protein LC640_12155 [Frankia sp.]|nr:hypothetical protein [Frankia sp.]